MLRGSQDRSLRRAPAGTARRRRRARDRRARPRAVVQPAAIRPWGASVRASANNLLRLTSRTGTPRSSARSTMSCNRVTSSWSAATNTSRTRRCARAAARARPGDLRPGHHRGHAAHCSAHPRAVCRPSRHRGRDGRRSSACCDLQVVAMPRDEASSSSSRCGSSRHHRDGEAHDAFTPADGAETLGRAGLHRYRRADGRAQEKLDLVAAWSDARALAHDRAVDVADRPARCGHSRHDVAQQRDRVGPREAIIVVGEELADVAQARSTQQPVSTPNARSHRHRCGR